MLAKFQIDTKNVCMELKPTSTSLIVIITLSACVGCASTSGITTGAETAVASQTSLTVVTIMPEQKCQAKLHGANLVRAEVAHESAQLCYYSG